MTSRGSKRSDAGRRGGGGLALGSFVICAACAAPQPPIVQAVGAESSSASPSRRPDGVVLEPLTAMPPAVTVAKARGVVALRLALSGEAVRACVEQLLDAWQQGSLDALAALLTSDAGPLEARARGPGALIEAFRQRLRAHDYKRLEGTELARLDRVEHSTGSESPGGDAPPRPPDMRPGEVYVRVPLEVTQIAGEKVFEPALLLVMRSEAGRARITAYGEGP